MMNNDQATVKVDRSIGPLIVQWILFAFELVFLFFLIVEIFLVPQMAAPWGDPPYEIRWATLSLFFALLGGVFFVKNRRVSQSVATFLKTPPVAVCLAVFLIVLVPAVSKWLQLKRIK